MYVSFARNLWSLVRLSKLKKKGVKTLIAASVAREEEAHAELLKYVDSIEIHEACRKKHGDLRRTCVSTKCATDKPSTSEKPPLQTNVVPKKNPSFDFKTLRFICCKPAENKSQGSFFTVKNKSTKYSFLDILETLPPTSEISSIIDRLRSTRDIVSSGAKYHQKCKMICIFDFLAPLNVMKSQYWRRYR